MITNCKKCGTEFAEPKRNDIIGDLVYFCENCKNELRAAEEKLQKFKVPGLDTPYKP